MNKLLNKIYVLLLLFLVGCGGDKEGENIVGKEGLTLVPSWLKNKGFVITALYNTDMGMYQTTDQMRMAMGEEAERLGGYFVFDKNFLYGGINFLTQTFSRLDKNRKIRKEITESYVKNEYALKHNFVNQKTKGVSIYEGVFRNNEKVLTYVLKLQNGKSFTFKIKEISKEKYKSLIKKGAWVVNYL